MNIMRMLILLFFAIISIQALENPIPSILLKPRDFNPHPYKEEAKRFVLATSDGEDVSLERKFYEQLVERFRNTGPVSFPQDPKNNYLAQQQQQRSNAVAHIIDKQLLFNPSYKEFQAKRLPVQTRFTNIMDQKNILAALANHAARVQNNEFQNNVQPPIYSNRIDDDNYNRSKYYETSDDFEKKQYNFAYAVKDPYSGDDFSHSQKQENGIIKGNYKVRLPDNRIQITKYIADHKGYRAEVIYEDDHNVPSHSHDILKIHKEQPPHKIQHYNINAIPPNENIPQFTVTPTPYEYSNIRAPVRKYFSTTTSISNINY